MILRTSKLHYLICGAMFVLLQVIFDLFSSGGNCMPENLIPCVIGGAFFSGGLLLMEKLYVNKARSCLKKIESTQKVICQGCAVSRTSYFDKINGWMLLGNTSLDFWKIRAKSGSKTLEIKLSDIISVKNCRNILTIQTNVQTFTFIVGQARVWKAQIDRAMQQNEPMEQTQQNETIDTQEIIKFKQLLDEGVISQEEFDAKKKQLLGL